MASDIEISQTAAEAMAQAFCDAINAAAPGQTGKLKIYSGTKPADADTVIGGGNTLLALLRFADPPETSVTDGVITFSDLTADSSANNSRTATCFRITDGNDVKIMDGTIGTSGADLNMPNVAIVQYANVAVTSFVLTIVKGL